MHFDPTSLDDAAVGLPLETAEGEHLAECDLCRRLVRERSAQDAALLADPRAERFRRALPSPVPRRQPTFRVWAPVALAAGLALALGGLALLPQPGPDRTKGSASLSILDLRGRALAHDERLAPGARVVLSLSIPDARFARLYAISADGAVTPVWPPGPAADGRLPVTGGGRLEPGFHVTPGGFRLVAYAGERFVSESDALEDAKRLAAACGFERDAVDCLAATGSSAVLMRTVLVGSEGGRP